MGVWTVYAAASFILIVAFYQLPQDALNIPLDLRAIPFPFNILFALIIVGAAFVIVLGSVSAVAVTVIHTFWILAGALFVSRSLNRSWKEVYENTFFRENGPSWLEADDERRLPKAAETNERNGEVEQLIDLDDEHETEDLYQVLDRNRGDMRLLKPVRDSSRESALHFELIQEPLSSVSGRYTALSYCCGAGHPNADIFIVRPLRRNFRVKIRPTLYEALRRLTDGVHEFIWVDALCINQKDLVERSAQVPRMRAVFTEAKIVMVWIDQALMKHCQQWRTDSNGGTSAIPSVNQSLQTRPSMHAIGDAILTNEYWDRLWIIQEFAVAGRIQVLTNNELLEEEGLRHRVDNASTGRNADSLKQVKNVMDVRTRWQSFVEPSLLDLLLQTSASRSSRRHDRVFGILSMTRDGRNFLTEPNYEISEAKLSLRMTRLYLQSRESHLDIILLGSHFSKKSELPSWCPDYFKFDDLPSDRRLFEYVRDVFVRVRSPPADTEVRRRYRPLFQANGETVCKARLEESTRPPATDEATAHLSPLPLRQALHSPAQQLGNITSLGWIASDVNMEDFPSRGPSADSDAKSGDIADALWSLLLTLSRRDFWGSRTQGKVPSAADATTENDYKTCTHPYIYFMLLAFGGGMHVEEVGALDGWYAQWLHANQRFVFGQRTLREHAKKMGSVLGYASFWKWADSVKDVVWASTWHAEIRDWKRIHQPLKTLAQQHMRLMSLTMDGRSIIALAHSDARVEDEVFLLPGCSVPVILRKVTERHEYSVVGDAIVPGGMFGEKWTSQVYGDLSEVAII